MKKTISTFAAVVVLAASASAVPLFLVKNHLDEAIQDLNKAKSEIQSATTVNAGAQKNQALQAIDTAIQHLKMAQKIDTKKDTKEWKKQEKHQKKDGNNNGPA
jgi:hypothetical protein